jgi:hypothetical protein
MQPRKPVNRPLREKVLVRADGLWLINPRPSPTANVTWALTVDPEREMTVRAVLIWDALVKQHPGRLRSCANDQCRLSRPAPRWSPRRYGCLEGGEQFGIGPAYTFDLNQCLVTPRDLLLPVLIGQPVGQVSGDRLHKRIGPWVVLTTLGAHPGIRWAHDLRVPPQTSARVELRGCERPDDRPPSAQPSRDDPVDVGGGGDAIADQAVRLAQQCALETVEDEALGFAFTRTGVIPAWVSTSRARATVCSDVNGAGTISATGSR